jgi:hypothetical protein
MPLHNPRPLYGAVSQSTLVYSRRKPRAAAVTPSASQPRGSVHPRPHCTPRDERRTLGYGLRSSGRGRKRNRAHQRLLPAPSQLPDLGALHAESHPPCLSSTPPSSSRSVPRPSPPLPTAHSLIS